MKKITSLIVFFVALATIVGLYNTTFSNFAHAHLFDWRLNTYLTIGDAACLVFYCLALYLLRKLYKKYAISFNLMFAYLTIILLIAVPTFIFSFFILN